ncbi:Nonribosomal peptide synthetases (NRPS) [Penicillium lividum]|nr:Nonribosomal peptide synthetases (NRPS) [Penicillium lividum]
MDNSQSVNTRFQPAKLALGKTTAQVLEIDANTLDWTKSFILLGGDSILAIDFVAKCRDAGFHVDMRELLMAESLGALAEQIDRENAGVANGVNGHDIGDNDSSLANWQDSMPDELVADLKTHNIALGDIESIAPCSAVQESFFVSQAINPTSYISHISIGLLSNSADRPRPTTERVIDAWRDLVQRHAILRTTFIESHHRPGKFDQLVLKPNTIPPRIIICPSTRGDHAVAPFTTGKFETPLRLCAYEVSDKELRLILEISHALLDGHSGAVLLHDFRASYEGAAYFSENALSYTSFASHQQAAMSTGVASAGTEYWITYLNNASESHLPVIASTPQLLHLKTARFYIPLPDGKLRAVCSQMMITPANVFQIAWALAIRRIILSDTVTFSHIVSGRNCDLEGAEGTVGPFINTLPYSVTLTPETSVADALFAARRDWQDGLPFQNIPIADLAVAKTQSLKRLGNTLLSIERETTNTEVFTEGISMTLDARTSATDVRSPTPAELILTALTT